MIARLLNRFAARRLAKHGHQSHRDRVRDTARRIREELQLPALEVLQ